MRVFYIFERIIHRECWHTEDKTVGFRFPYFIFNQHDAAVI